MTCSIRCTSRSGEVLSPQSYMDVPAELQNYPPISIPFSKEKHHILHILGAFYYNLLKIHPIFKSGLLRLWWKPPDQYTKFHKKAPGKTQAHISSVNRHNDVSAFIFLIWYVVMSIWRRYKTYYNVAANMVNLKVRCKNARTLNPECQRAKYFHSKSNIFSAILFSQS